MPFQIPGGDALGAPSSSLTLGSLVEQVMLSINGQVAQLDASAALVESISSTSTTIKVDDAASIDSTYVEIDLELIRVTSVDRTANTITVAPTGRGRRGTLAAGHEAGAEIRVQPIMPYQSVVREVQAELNTLYPRLSSIGVAGFESAGVETFPLPADTGAVLDVRCYRQGGGWDRLDRWELVAGESTDQYPTGVALRLGAFSSGTLRIVYGRRFGKLTSLAQTLASAGIPESMEDLIRLGVIIRLLPTLDLARMSAISVSSSEAAARSPQPGTGIMLSREMRSQYKERLEAEVSAFRQLYPARLHVVQRSTGFTAGVTVPGAVEINSGFGSGNYGD